MAEHDYPQVRYEKFYVVDDAVSGDLSQPTAQDAVKALVLDFPGIGPDFVESEERRETPDIDQYIERKTAPGTFRIESYAKAPLLGGQLPTYMNLLKNGYGVEKQILTVLAFGSGAGDTITVTINGTPTVLTEGVGFTAVTSNAATATSIAAAINALSGVSAAAGVVATDTVEIQRDAGTHGLDVVVSDTVFANKTKVIYSDLALGLEELSLSMWLREDNYLRGFRDCHVNTIEWDANGTREPRVIFGGLYAHEVAVGTTTLAAGYTSGGTAITLTNKVLVGVGVETADKIKVKIDSEVFLVTAFDATTGIATVVGAQDGTIAANHSIGAEVAPATPGVDPDTGDIIIPLTIGSLSKGSDTPRITAVNLVQNNGLAPRIDEAFEPVMTGIRRENPRRLTGSFEAYHRKGIHHFATHLRRAVEEALVLTLGSAGTEKITVTWPKSRIVSPPTRSESGGEFKRAFPVVGLATTTPGNDNSTVEFS